MNFSVCKKGSMGNEGYCLDYSYRTCYGAPHLHPHHVNVHCFRLRLKSTTSSIRLLLAVVVPVVPVLRALSVIGLLFSVTRDPVELSSGQHPNERLRTLLPTHLTQTPPSCPPPQATRTSFLGLLTRSCPAKLT